MSKPTILLVDNDSSNRQILESALRKGGFIVTTASDGKEALKIVGLETPNIILTETLLPEVDGFELYEAIKLDLKILDIVYVFLTSQHLLDDKIKALKLGCDEYLTKPIFIKELLVRLEALLKRSEQQKLTQKQKTDSVSGNLADLTVLELIQAFEIGNKSGTIHLSSMPYHKNGAIFFRQGTIIDAFAGEVHGEAAIFRLLRWNNGTYEIDFGDPQRESVIKKTTQMILIEGMRRLDEWGQLLEELPSVETIMAKNLHEETWQKYFPSEASQIINLFDGNKSILDVVESSTGDDLKALELIGQAYFEGIICELATTDAGICAKHLISNIGENANAENVVYAVPSSEPEVLYSIGQQDGLHNNTAIPGNAALVNGQSHHFSQTRASIPHTLDENSISLDVDDLEIEDLSGGHRIEQPGIRKKLHLWSDPSFLRSFLIVSILWGVFSPIFLPRLFNQTSASLDKGASKSLIAQNQVIRPRMQQPPEKSSDKKHPLSIKQYPQSSSFFEHQSLTMKPMTTSPAKNRLSNAAQAAKTSNPKYALFITQVDEIIRRPNRWEYLTPKDQRRVYHLLKQALEMNPESWQALQELALVELKRGASDKALRLAKRASEINSFAPYAMLVIGSVHQSRHNLHAAKVAYLKFLKTCPDCRYADEVRMILKRWKRE